MKGEGGEGDTLCLRETRPNWVIKARARAHGGPVVDRPTLAVQYQGFRVQRAVITVTDSPELVGGSQAVPLKPE